MMEPVIAPFLELLQQVHFQAPADTLCLQCHGPVGHGRRRQPVPVTGPGTCVSRCALPRASADLLTDPQTILLEVGPGQTLSTLARQHPAKPATQVVLASLPAAAKAEKVEQAGLLTSLGQLWLAGAPVDWKRFYQGEERRRVSLPTYPFERQRYWAEPGIGEAAPQRAAARGGSGRYPSGLGASRAGGGTRRASNTPLAPGTDSSHSDWPVGGTLGRQTYQPSACGHILEMGFDSLFLAQASQAFEKKFGLKVTFRQLLGRRCNRRCADRIPGSKTAGRASARICGRTLTSVPD